MEKVSDLGNWNVLVHGRDGHFVANSNDTYIGRSLIRYGEFSSGEMALFRQVLKPGDVVAEIGANIGAHTVGLARLVGPSGRVLGYEPQPVVFQSLCANVALNGLVNVETKNIALGESKGTTIVPPISYDQEGNFGAFSLDEKYRQGITIDVDRLDDVFSYSRLNLIKIDVEGMEQEVLRGARSTIDRLRPVLYVENDRVDRSEGLIRLIMEMGYHLWWHTPRLFSDDNFFGERENIFGNIVSVNLLCLHASASANLEGFIKVEDPTQHPLVTANR